ncbi:hypothetical protein EYR40_007266 [Pleurotus pulmonarius]|nr:hypothetical protein EYR36_003451 [Pleurotus pulmonarius]KAF4600155.1 hypothetical protein EYR40_007266 [Pleurotus pulmonarius]
MSDERDIADFISSLFRGCGLDEPNSEEVINWMTYSSGRESSSSIFVAEDSAIAPSVGGGNMSIIDSNEEQKDTSEGGHVGDVFNDGDVLSAVSVGGLLDRLFKEVEAVRREEKPAVPTWCIIA